MDYCLDTSVYTQAHRTYYAFDLAPGFWSSLKIHADGGKVISPLAVLDELSKGKDELASWAKDNKGVLFVDPDDKVVDAYKQVADFANSRYQDEHWIRSFLEGADPWVIAHAVADGLVVVSMENNKPTENTHPGTGKYVGSLKIPNMCAHLEVKSISTYDLVRALKIKLV